MNKKRNYYLWCLPYFILTLSAYSEQIISTENTDEVVAKVNGKPIYENQLDVELTRQLQKHKNPQPEIIEKLRQNALDKVIEREVLFQASQNLDIPDADEKAEENFLAIKEKIGSEERFQSYLKAYKQTSQQMRTTARQKIFMDEYLKRQGLLEPAVSEEEIKAFYQKASFKREEAVHLKHILVAIDEEAEPTEKEQLRQKAEKLRRMIIEGADFSELAKEHSDSAEAEKAGGDLGYIKRDYMPAEFDKVVFSLKDNEVSHIIETKFGYHIVKLIDKRPAGNTPYDEVHDFIKKYLQNQRRPQMIAAHIEELKLKAKIEKK